LGSKKRVATIYVNGTVRIWNLLALANVEEEQQDIQPPQDTHHPLQPPQDLHPSMEVPPTPPMRRTPPAHVAIVTPNPATDRVRVESVQSIK